MHPTPTGACGGWSSWRRPTSLLGGSWCSVYSPPSWPWFDVGPEVERDGLLEELIGAVWISIRTMRMPAEDQHIAAALVLDATHRAFTAPLRRRSASEVTIDPRLLEETPTSNAVSPCEELAEVLVEARRAGLTDGDTELVRQLLALGSTTAVAEARRVTPRTVRNHRDQVTYRIRRLATAAA